METIVVREKELSLKMKRNLRMVEEDRGKWRKRKSSLIKGCLTMYVLRGFGSY